MRILVLLIFVFVFCYPQHRRQAVRDMADTSIANRPIENLELNESNIHLTLSKISTDYKVPIGLEVAVDDDLVKEDRVVIKLNNTTLEKALRALVAQKPMYEWIINKDVVYVFPKDNHTDPVVRAVLEAEIKEFSIERGTSRANIRRALGKQPELQKVLDANGVVATNDIFSSYDIRPAGRTFSLHVSKVTVRSILDELIRGSETKYWSIRRFGDNKRFLRINF